MNIYIYIHIIQVEKRRERSCAASNAPRASPQMSTNVIYALTNIYQMNIVLKNIKGINSCKII